MIDATYKSPPVFYVRMFGGFELSAAGQTISDTINHTRQLWNLLEYLFAHRRQDIPQHELLDALWPEGSIDNPANALKNLAYRVRTTLAKNSIPCAKELIAFRDGSYRISSDLHCVLDIEEFEDLSRQALRLTDHDQLATAYLDMFDLYCGDFLPSSRHEKWVALLAGYYRSLYFKNVRAAAELFLGMGRYDDVCAICEKAARVDPLEECAYPYLIRALIRQNR